MKEVTKKTLKIAVFVYLLSFLVINWNDVSWIFNYREISGILGDFFNPYPSIDAKTIQVAYFNSNQTASAIAGVKTNYTSKQNTIEIPKILISAPIIFSVNPEKGSLEKDLNLGVVYYPGSVLPGQVGQIVILGHSAPPGWPKTRYEWVFSDIDKLTTGDIILINLNNKQYTYVVKQKSIIKKGADIPSSGFNANDNILTLISCWPPGKDYQRITVQAELQKS